MLRSALKPIAFSLSALIVIVALVTPQSDAEAGMAYTPPAPIVTRPKPVRQPTRVVVPPSSSPHYGYYRPRPKRLHDSITIIEKPRR